jgi:hypothetical protein
MHDPDDEALIEQILPVLDLDHQYTRLVEAWNQDRVAQIRRCGRSAGRRLGYKIRTFATDPQSREDGHVAVWVVVTSSNPADDERIRERGDLLMREALNLRMRPETHHRPRALEQACRRRPIRGRAARRLRCSNEPSGAGSSPFNPCGDTELPKGVTM